MAEVRSTNLRIRYAELFRCAVRSDVVVVVVVVVDGRRVLSPCSDGCRTSGVERAAADGSLAS